MKKWVFAISIFLLIVFVYPKTTDFIGFQKSFICECFGFPISVSEEMTMCYGMPFSCEEKSAAEVIELKQNKTEVCVSSSCKTIQTYLGYGENKQSGKKVKVSSVNLILVLDVSQSMEGARIENLKSAAVKLVGDLGGDDSAAVIKFSDTSEIVHPLSKDTRSLISAINLILAKGETKYLPALTLAESIITNLDLANEKTLIIFLSDGIPADNPDKILTKANNLKRRGVDIYTISFGDSAGNTDESSILHQMSLTPENADLQRYYHSEDISSVYATFSRIYEKVVYSQHQINIDSYLPKTKYMTEESIEFFAELFSGENERIIPGYVMEYEQVLCVPKAEVELTAISNEGKELRYVLDYVPRHYEKSVILPEGVYRLSLEARVALDNDSNCVFTGKKELGVINVTSEAVFGECEKLNCEEIKELLSKQAKENSSIVIKKRNESENTRITLIMDTSASMNGIKIEKAKEAAKRLADMVYWKDDLSLISFDENSKLIQGFTNNRTLMKEKIESLTLGSTTNYVPPLKKAFFTIQGSGKNKNTKDMVIFLTDGSPWDSGKPNTILDGVSSLVKENICLYTIAYGTLVLTEPEAKEILTSMAEVSQEHTGCGEYFYASESEDELFNILSSIYENVSVGSDDLDITVKTNKQSYKENDEMSLQAEVFSKYNGIEIPVIFENFTGTYCIPPAWVTTEIFDNRNISIKKEKLRYFPESNYYIKIGNMSKDMKTVSVEGQIMGSTNLCELRGQKSFNINVGIDEVSNRQFWLKFQAGMVILILLLTIILSCYLLIVEVVRENKKIN